MTYEQLKKRVELMSERRLIFSNQYGMLFILNEDGEILLDVTELVEDSETFKALRNVIRRYRHLSGLASHLWDCCNLKNKRP